jgi:hypothetical protein
VTLSHKVEASFFRPFSQEKLLKEPVNFLAVFAQDLSSSETVSFLQ